MKHLYFVRHGESEMNVQGVFAGRTDTPLTDKGRKQAALAGTDAIAYNIGLIISSHLERALETAQIIAKEIGYPVDKILVDDRLQERNFGDLEGTPYTATPDYTNVQGLETNPEIIKRAHEVYAHIKSLPGANILVVSHGSIGRALRSVCQPDIDFESRIPNAQIVQLV